MLELLQPYIDDHYQSFSSNIITTKSPILGIRIPVLRKIAKQILKEQGIEYYWEIENDCYEAIMIKGFMIGYSSLKLNELIKYIQNYVPLIDNWSTCDGFCATLKKTKKYQEDLFALFCLYARSKEEFSCRFGVVMLMTYYLDDIYLSQSLAIFDEIKLDYYYVRMAIAWATASAWAKNPQVTKNFFYQCHYDDWTYNKTISKLNDSYRISKEDKELAKSWRK